MPRIRESPAERGIAQQPPSYLHHGMQCGVQAMEPIFIPRDLNIEYGEIHWKPLPQENSITSPEISLTKTGFRED